MGIIDLSLASLQKRLEEREITLKLTDEARRYIAHEAYDPAYGARPVKRYLQKHVETALASQIIRGQIQDGDAVTIDADESGLTFEV